MLFNNVLKYYTYNKGLKLNNYLHSSAKLINLQQQSKQEVCDWLGTFDTILTDCDGVLWVGKNEIQNASKTLNKFKEIGKRVFYLTNNSSITRQDLVNKAQKLNFKCCWNDCLSTTYTAVHYLKQNKVKKVYLLGSEALVKELDNAGIKHVGFGPDVVEKSLLQELAAFKLENDVDAVLVGFDVHISFKKIMKAANYLQNPGCLFVVTNRDANAKHKFVKPDTGTILAAIQTASDRIAVDLGKPNSYLVDVLRENNEIVAEKTLMIGDRCNTDILFGNRCGFSTLLVLSGWQKLEEVLNWKNSVIKEEIEMIPNAYVNSIGDLLTYL